MSQTFKGKITENELVALLKQKDKATLGYLYDNYSAALFGIILRIIQDKKVAEEVLQDAFMKIWDKIDTYDDKKGRLFTWMLNLCRNLAIDKLRSKEIKKVGKTDDIEENVYHVEKDYLVQQSVDGIGVKELLVKLRDEERLILELIYFKGYTQSEVSESQGIPLGTVKTRLRMALINLRKELGVT